MASTNKTTHYELSQYIGSDKPSYLGDYNSDMGKIDAGIYGAQSDATSALADSASATLTANSALTAIGDLEDLNTTTKTDLVSAINEALVTPSITLITGTVTLQAMGQDDTNYKMTAFSINYPTGYTQTNTYVLSFAGSLNLSDNIGGYGVSNTVATMLTSSELPRTIGFNSNDNISVAVWNPSTSELTYNYKIVLMKL